MASLLEQAKLAPFGHKSAEITDQQIEVALGYLKGEIAYVQARHVLHGTHKSANTKTYITLCRALLEAYRRGKLTIN